MDSKGNCNERDWFPIEPTPIEETIDELIADDAVEYFNLDDAKALMKAPPRNIFYTKIKRRLRSQIAYFQDEDDFCYEEDIEIFHVEEDECFPKQEDLEKMFKSDGFTVEISYSGKTREEKTYVSFAETKIHYYVHIEVLVKNTWSRTT